jgi:hypothetical protein
MGETMKSATAIKTLSALLMLGLGACATTQERMNGWVGTTDAHLLSAWGAPDRKAKAGGGINVVTYKEKGAGKHSASCHKTFAIDADHRVIGASTTCR